MEEPPGMGMEAEATSRVSPAPPYLQQQQHTAGIIKRIRLENFMCHSNFEMEFGDAANFILGQNGSGKSAILTALCVAFGCRAKGTQRASTLKDFIKSGCSNAVVHVEIQNEGEDAFKPETYGDVIIIERRISESTSSTTLKDHQGKKVVSRKADLQEIIEHFNIDVENPCVIMSQDKSREFLHSGNNKDKFKFFYKATLLQQVNDLLESISKEIEHAHVIVEELAGAIRPIEKELSELEVKIKDMEQVEQMSEKAQQLKKKLAWLWVYEVDKDLQRQSILIDKLKSRIPACQAKIDQHLHEIEKLKESCSKKKDEIAGMLETTTQLNKMTEDLKHSMSLATKEVFKLEQDIKCKTSSKDKILDQLKMLQQQVQDIQEQHVKHTQAEKSDLEEKLMGLHEEVHAAEQDWERLKEEVTMLSSRIHGQDVDIKMIGNKIQDHENKYRDIFKNIRDLEQSKINKISAFGGNKVMSLLRTIEKYHRRFKMPPIGPIGAHLKLLNGEKWAVAVEHAIGRMLNSFIVNDHKDFHLLKQCAKEAEYGHLQIIIYDFSTPRLTIPQHMIPITDYPSTLSILQSENHTVINVLVDLGHVERQLLVEDYDTGKKVAFEQRIRNLKEIYTVEGHKIFSRGNVQTVLPPNIRIKAGRLCSSYEKEIKKLQIEASTVQEAANEFKRSKREAEIKLEDLQRNLTSVKRRYETAGRSVSSKKVALEEAMQQHAAENSSIPSSSVEELNKEISEVQKKIKEEEKLLEGLEKKRQEASIKADHLKVEFDKLCESANGDIAAFKSAEDQLMKLERELESAKDGKKHYDGVMEKQVLHIKKAEEEYQELTKKREESAKKASIICSEADLNSLEGCDGETPAKISAQLESINQIVQRESRRYTETIGDLRSLYDKKERKIKKRRQVYKDLRQKLDACQRALEIRGSKFKRNASYLKQQLSWKFNGHLRKKGISGLIKVNYEEKTLSIEVQMPQDASNRAVRDTRGLSGGERSFSTLCFALALHEMTEAPFRAMDEFDVFMDAVSRKISLDTLVDFAVAHGSQWLFITPHDTSMVKPGPKVRKLQMPAPRS